MKMLGAFIAELSTAFAGFLFGWWACEKRQKHETKKRTELVIKQVNGKFYQPPPPDLRLSTPYDNNIRCPEIDTWAGILFGHPGPRDRSLRLDRRPATARRQPAAALSSRVDDLWSGRLCFGAG
jgi:hypothetical protein